MQPLGTKKNHATYQDQKLTQPLGTTKIMPPLSTTKKVMQPLETKKNHANGSKLLQMLQNG